MLGQSLNYLGEPGLYAHGPGPGLADDRPLKRARNSLSDGADMSNANGLPPPPPPSSVYHYPPPPPPGYPTPSAVSFPNAAPPTYSQLPSGKGIGPTKEPVMTQSHRKEPRSQKTLSCMECRRLKLKCDRVFPCSSCCKRGCSEICPDGALTSGRGSRFILANTEQLHDKITQLSERVRQLEEALEESSSSSHPLLSPELLRIKASLDVQGTVPATRPRASNSISETREEQNVQSIQIPFVPNPSQNMDLVQHQRYGSAELTSPTSGTRSRSTTPEVPPDILQLSTTFPFPWCVDLKIRKRIRDALPSREEAQFICEEARRNALWQFNVDASNTFLDNLLNHVYSTPIQELSPRRLALLLMNLAIGSIVSEKQAVGSHTGEAYHHLARASVCEIPLMEAPDFDVLHALFYMIWYHLIFSDNKKAVTYAWNLMGFVAKLSQGLGLHRDSSHSKVIPEEDERRRTIFWELVNLDSRLSLSLGRPPSLYLMHVDTKPPTYEDSGLFATKGELLYHDWKTKFLICCLDPILQATIKIPPPPYKDITRLDKDIRDFDIPPMLDHPDSTMRFLAMQSAVAHTGRDIALMQLHRRYFLKAMSGNSFDMYHQYAPSVLATYSCCSSLISETERLFNAEPHLSVRFLHFWFNVFSAAVALCLFVTRVPSSPLAPFALQELERVSQLFRRVAVLLPFCAKALPILEKLVDKPRRSYRHWLGVSSQKKNSDPTFMQSQRHQLPPSFMDTHDSLRHIAEQISWQSPPPESQAPVSRSQILESQRQADSLPEVYSFSCMGLGTGDRFAPSTKQFATLKPHPFIPSAPRIGENEEFNLDFGALTLDLTDTSYMAWF